MSNNFYQKFDDFYNGKNNLRIPMAKKYEQIISALQKFNNNNDEKPTQTEKNWITRYNLRLDNSVNLLFCGDKRVIKYEEIYDLLQQTHHKLGHGGRDAMWADFSGIFGISK